MAAVRLLDEVADNAVRTQSEDPRVLVDQQFTIRGAHRDKVRVDLRLVVARPRATLKAEIASGPVREELL